MSESIKTKLKEIISKHADAGFDILTPPDPKMGDYSTNLAFVIAKKEGKPVEEIANELKVKLESDKNVGKIFEPEIRIEKGFLNFFLKKEILDEKLSEILKEKENYGQSGTGKKKKINLEFISANPTGPLTVGNARAASYGDTLGNIFNKAGFKCWKEYYFNDAGVQVFKLGKSVYRRIQELRDEEVIFEDDLYKGDYVKSIAEDILTNRKDEIPVEENEAIKFCQSIAVDEMEESAKASAARLGVEFDEWFRESRLHDSGEIKEALEYLEDKELIYEKDGAKWFKVSQFYPDQQDAVVVKSDGSTSYLMNDIAYTRNKFEKRDFDRAINIWGTDHHGDVPRLKAGAEAFGFKEDNTLRLEILLHQLVLIKEKDEFKRMSKREGQFILLDDFINEVGKDAIRFFFLMKDLNTHMEFDVELAKEQSKKNPVFYAQYAFARANSIFAKAGIKMKDAEDKNLEKLNSKEELVLIRNLIKFPELIEEIARDYKIHHLPLYVLNLANDFHKFYETNRIIQDDRELQEARLALVKAVAVVLKISLGLMGISAPEKM